jgi:hypothetical protein
MLFAVRFASKRENHSKIVAVTYIKRMYKWNTSFICKKSIKLKLTLYISSVASWCELVISLFSNYKTSVIWLIWLLHMQDLWLSTKGKLNTVNMEYNVANSKNYHLSYTHTNYYIDYYY